MNRTRERERDVTRWIRRRQRGGGRARSIERKKRFRERRRAQDVPEHKSDVDQSDDQRRSFDRLIEPITTPIKREVSLVNKDGTESEEEYQRV